jgi:DNA-binding NarL/FixJ family response regulator
MMESILIIDDEPKLLQETLAMFGYDFKVSHDGITGLSLLNDTSLHFQLVILDVNVPRLDGWGALKQIRQHPRYHHIPIIMVAEVEDETTTVAALRWGADEFLVKPTSHNLLLAHIEALTRRARWESEALAQQNDPQTLALRESAKALTHRESEILEYLVRGLSNQDIGQKLVISETTVKNHLAHIFKKLKVSNRTQAAYIAQKLGLG